MTDYIRKAVELADGWHLNGTVFGTPNDGPDLDDIKNITQQDLDALAAQLVRQVDAIERWIVDAECDGTDILDDYDRGSLKAQALGPDRTMNTIKAIVDSGVLEDKR